MGTSIDQNEWSVKIYVVRVLALLVGSILAAFVVAGVYGESRSIALGIVGSAILLPLPIIGARLLGLSAKVGLYILIAFVMDNTFLWTKDYSIFRNGPWAWSISVAGIVVLVTMLILPAWKWGWRAMFLIWLLSVVIPQPIIMVMNNAFEPFGKWQDEVWALMDWELPELLAIMLAAGIVLAFIRNKWLKWRSEIAGRIEATEIS